MHPSTTNSNSKGFANRSPLQTSISRGNTNTPRPISIIHSIRKPDQIPTLPLTRKFINGQNPNDIAFVASRGSIRQPELAVKGPTSSRIEVDRRSNQNLISPRYIVIQYSVESVLNVKLQRSINAIEAKLISKCIHRSAKSRIRRFAFSLFLFFFCRIFFRLFFFPPLHINQRN